jgi:hypothetical protein
MKPPDAVVLLLFLDQAQLAFAGRGVKEQPCSKQLIDQDSPVLRIILEFDDVVEAVVARHQVRLRAAPHAAYLLQRPQHGGLC